MVQLGSTFEVEDSAGVELELGGLGVDGDRDGLQVERGHQLVGLVGRHVHEAAVFEGGSELLAFSVTRGVGVGLLSRDSVRLHPVEGVVHKASVAPVVAVFGAVD